MKHPMLRSLPAMGAALMSCGLAGSCATTLPRGGDAGPTSSHPSQPAVTYIAQLEHGREARFTTCVPAACPAITPKTLGRGNHAVAPQRAREPIASVNAGAASEDRRVDVARLASEPARRPEQPVQMPSLVTELAVTFASGSATLSTAARASLDLALKAPGITRLAIRGRTDSTGPSHINQALAADRARAVEAHLRRAHPRLAGLVSTVDATGACCYVASNETPDGRARNRRVEIDIEQTTGDP